MAEAATRVAAHLEDRIRGSVSLGAPLAPFTTYRLGGPAAVLVEAAGPSDLDALAEVWPSSGLPLLVVGRGSNMLVADAGFPGVALHLAGSFVWMREEDALVRAGGGTTMPNLARWAAKRGLGGLEWGVAVPGTVGGAVRMNAGAHGTETKDVLVDSDVLDLSTGERTRRKATDLGFAYRHSELTGAAVVEAGSFHYHAAEPGELERAMREIVRWRKENQPGGEPNAGSIFANPEGDTAGRLVDAAGLKGHGVGRARVSEKHANFIVTAKGATASEVARLILHARRSVAERFGIMLRLEVRLVGDFPPDVRELREQ